MTPDQVLHCCSALWPSLWILDHTTDRSRLLLNSSLTLIQARGIMNHNNIVLALLASLAFLIGICLSAEHASGLTNIAAHHNQRLAENMDANANAANTANTPLSSGQSGPRQQHVSYRMGADATGIPPAHDSLRRATSPPPMVKVELAIGGAPGPTATQLGTSAPRCADGTPYAFYMRAPSSAAASTLVFLNGGGACLNTADCASRLLAYPELFTSALLASHTIGYDVLSPDPIANPTFHNAGHVFLPYCTQDLWAGGGGVNLSASATTAFAGLANLAAVWDYLALRNTTVLLGGSSAGGVGAVRFAALLSDSGLLGTHGLRLRLLLDSAWFVDYRASLSTQLALMPVPALQWWGVPDLSLCSQRLAPSTMSCCLDPLCMVDRIVSNSSSQVTDVFVAESLYDPYVLAVWLANQLSIDVNSLRDIATSVLSNQIDASLGMYSVSSGRGTPALVSGPRSQSPIDTTVVLLALLEQYSGFLLDSIARYAANQRLRFFAPACVQHGWLRPERADAAIHESSGLVLTVVQGTWALAAVEACTLQQAIGGWWAGSNASSESFGHQCSSTLTSSCAGAGCEQSCGVRFNGVVAHNSWEGPKATGLLVLATVVVLLIVCAWLSLLLLAAFVRWKISWTKAFDPRLPRTKTSPRLQPAVSGPDSDPKLCSSLPVVPSHLRLTVSARSVSYYAGHCTSQPILSNVSFHFASNSLIGIIGSSGCGKTTLLDLLANRRQHGLLEGTLSLNGVDMATCNGLAVRKKIAYVRQFGGCYSEHLTVFDNIMYAALLRLPGTLTLQQRKDTVMAILGEVGLAHRAHYRVGSDDAYGGGGPSISGGQKRRLAIALELLTEPAMLLMDEPTSGLDAASCLAFMTWLRAYCNTGRTVVMSIHQPRAEVFSKFDNLLVMQHGRAVMYAAPAVVVERFLWHATQLGAVPVATSNEADLVMDILGNTALDVAQHVQREHEASPAHAAMLAGLQKNRACNTVQRPPILSDMQSPSHSHPASCSAVRTLWWRLKLCALKAMAQTDRQSRGMQISVLAMCGQELGFGLIFGLLYRKAELGYVFASAIVCLQTAIVPCMFVFATPKFQQHLATFRKDNDCGAVSGTLFACSSVLVYSSLFVLPSVLACVLTFSLVLGDNISAGRVAALASISLGTAVTGLMVLLTAGGLTHVLQLNASQSNGIIASAGIGFWSFFGIMSSFYIAEPVTPIYMRWLYYISPQFYFFSSAARVLMEGLPVVCSSNRMGSIAACIALSPAGYLENRAYTSVDVGHNAGMQMVLALFYFAVFLAMVTVLPRLRTIRLGRNSIALMQSQHPLPLHWDGMDLTEESVVAPVSLLRLSAVTDVTAGQHGAKPSLLSGASPRPTATLTTEDGPDMPWLQQAETTGEAMETQTPPATRAYTPPPPLATTVWLSAAVEDASSEGLWEPGTFADADQDGYIQITEI